MNQPKTFVELIWRLKDSFNQWIAASTDTMALRRNLLLAVFAFLVVSSINEGQTVEFLTVKFELDNKKIELSSLILLTVSGLIYSSRLLQKWLNLYLSRKMTKFAANKRNFYVEDSRDKVIIDRYSNRVSEILGEILECVTKAAPHRLDKDGKFDEKTSLRIQHEIISYIASDDYHMFEIFLSDSFDIRFDVVTKNLIKEMPNKCLIDFRMFVLARYLGYAFEVLAMLGLPVGVVAFAWAVYL